MKTRSQTELSLSDNFHYAYYVLDFRRIVADKTKWIRYTWTYRDCGCHRCCNNCYYEINTNFIFIAFSLFQNCCCCWGCQCFCCHQRRRRRHRIAQSFTWALCLFIGSDVWLWLIICLFVVLGLFTLNRFLLCRSEIQKKVSLWLKRYENWRKMSHDIQRYNFFPR